jgi:cell division septum initiation protein DivIVA
MSRFRKPTDISQKPRDLQTDTAERLEAIVEAAERAAEGVIDDAEAQARRYLAQARSDADRLAVDRTEELSDLIASLLGQAMTLREEAERLQATLENASARLAGHGAETPAPAPPAPAPVAQYPEPEAPRLRAVDADAAPAVEAEVGRANAAGARLLATQMAVSGNSREEIAERLRNGFEIEDTDAILDAILGPEGR